ncbi:MmgE/PrpD family protein [Gordonia caeni]|uniref:MmgE/PrpD family protein n=1 Tax=Gordonia caeni TaxID=1007097 RepID=A0ABP7NNW5_9ACTN
MIAPELARWAVGLRPADIPRSARAAALDHVLDGLGNGIAARRLGHGAEALMIARGLGGPPQAHVIGDVEKIGTAAAAFANGVLVHALDFDDTHALALVHPTAVVLPAAFAVAQEVGADGATTLTAIVAGLEIACRLGAGTPHGFHGRGFHATGVVGPPAAAVTAALLYGAGEETVVNAIGIAASSSSGILEFLETGSNTKTIHPGSASLNGVIAARLAVEGADGPVSALEGGRGLYRAFAHRAPELDTVIGDLGTRWETESIGIKPYPSCQLMHSALDAALRARELRTDVSEIAEIAVGIHPDSLGIVAGPAAGQRVPRTAYDAKFDLPWSVAAALHDGAVTVETYTGESIARPEVAETAARVRVYAVDDERPAADVGARVAITRVDGSAQSGLVDASRGSRARPMSTADVRAKFVANCGVGGGSVTLADRILHLADVTSVSTVLTEAADVVGN